MQRPRVKAYYPVKKESLHRLLLRSGLSRDAFAAAAGLAPSTLDNWLNPRHEGRASHANVAALARAHRFKGSDIADGFPDGEAGPGAEPGRADRFVWQVVWNDRPPAADTWAKVTALFVQACELAGCPPDLIGRPGGLELIDAFAGSLVLELAGPIDLFEEFMAAYSAGRLDPLGVDEVRVVHLPGLAAAEAGELVAAVGGPGELSAVAGGSPPGGGRVAAAPPAQAKGALPPPAREPVAGSDAAAVSVAVGWLLERAGRLAAPKGPAEQAFLGRASFLRKVVDDVLARPVQLDAADPLGVSLWAMPAVRRYAVGFQGKVEGLVDQGLRQAGFAWDQRHQVYVFAPPDHPHPVGGDIYEWAAADHSPGWTVLSRALDILAANTQVSGREGAVTWLAGGGDTRVAGG